MNSRADDQLELSQQWDWLNVLKMKTLKDVILLWINWGNDSVKILISFSIS